MSGGVEGSSSCVTGTGGGDLLLICVGNAGIGVLDISAFLFFRVGVEVFVFLFCGGGMFFGEV